ncbi:ABC transporter permease [Larkinella soli]|uniref:ABC transporter permease n=1 Tax=Larkinella soli TaxID=1770527 RepID=UPI000FFC0342|nr:ABC transporter permease [Larkinella soli]
MFNNYLKIAFRNLWKNKAFTFINISGLALGLTTFLFILEFISFEYGVNRFHKNLPTLYRMLAQNREGATFEFLPPGVGPLTRQQFGEVARYCRTADVIVGIVSSGDPVRGKSFRENAITMADGSFFEMFSFPVVSGSANSLNQPFTVAISESVARKYFGGKPALGLSLTLTNQFGRKPYTVTAVYRDMPANSDFRYDMLFSLKTLENPANLNGNADWAKLDNLESGFTQTYLQLREGADYLAFEQKLNAFKNKLRPETAGEPLRLQPLKNVHLASSLGDTFTTTGKLSFVYLLGGIGLLILAIAWFNYINLSTAGSLKRAREVGVRKAVGAGREQLIAQFLGESVLLNLFGLGLALLLVTSLQDAFNQFTGKPLSLGGLFQGGLWAVGVAGLVVSSLASGMYVAFVLSSFRPTQTLKGVFARSSRGVFLRQSLVVVQFSISVALIASTAVLYRQLQYMQNKDLGVKTDQLLVIQAPEVSIDETFQTRKTAFLQEFEQLAFVQEFCKTTSVPSRWYNFKASGITRPVPKPGEERKSYAIAGVDHRFVPTYGLKLAAGSNITEAMGNKPWDQVTQVMLNETAVRQLGFESTQQAVGKRIRWGRDYEVVGVLKDYHHQSVRQAIDPIIFYPQTNNASYYTVRLTGDRMPEKVAQLEQLYKRQFPGNPFDFFFVDDNYNRLYQSERQSGTLFALASGLAILIACMGLFGLAAFMAEQRTKEIGVRKVLGASITSIAVLLSGDFLKLVAVAIVIASPLAWWLMNQWLQDFAYKVDLDWWVFALAGLAATLIALATVSFQSIRAALANPVKSLRSE